MTRREKGESLAYSTAEQRRHAGWIGSIKCEVVLEQARVATVE